MRRDGELTEQSLLDALATEQAEGGRPTKVAVGSEALALVARRIVGQPGGVTVLAAVFPAVEVDGALGASGWELRES
jgi:hypothetical protein